MNFVNLMENIKNGIDYNAFCTLRNDFIENNFCTAYESLKPCKSTAAKAVRKYIASATFKDETAKGAYTNGYTVLMVSADMPEEESETIKKTDIAGKVMDIWETRKPASDCYFLDSVALYKAFKKQQKGEYLLHLDGNYYNAAFVAEMIECIATDKTSYIRAEIAENGALFVKQNGGAALILPVKRSGIHISQNVNSREFFKYLNDIEDKYIEEIRRTA